MRENILYALVATTGTWLLTALGAATVIFIKKSDKRIFDIMLGFAAGVMIAASFWSLLAPAVEIADKISKIPSYLSVTGGFLTGALFILILDKTIKAVKIGKNNSTAFNRVLLLITSITLHNIPEGLAVGVAFGALKGENYTTESIMGAVGIAVGIGLQNFPEGAAVSLPLRREGYGRLKSFLIGQASGIVEPIAGTIGATLVIFANRILPFALSFAAGAMITVTVHELIPECQNRKEKEPYFATAGIICGFAVMTLLDVMLA
ncbi:MAG: ZIP family metal transporter [Clostridia bacterium]|nr:ZIP family metal transporter [Clostridia bacterium]